MAMQPIDLQTLFTQMDKVGKNQTIQKEGLQIQEALHQVQVQKKAEEQVRSVNEAQNTGEGAAKIKDEDERRQAQPEGKPEEAEAPEEEKEEVKIVFIRDPSLGRNIDISG